MNPVPHTITPALAHVSCDENLLVRNVRAAAEPHTYRSWLIIDGTHPYLYENPAIANHVSGTTFIDMGRQLLKAITHLYYGTPLDSRFVLHNVDIEFLRWAKLGVAIEVTVSAEVPEARREGAPRSCAAVLEWRRLDRAREALWSARQLAELASVEPDELTPDERAFLGASRGRSRRARWLRGAALLALPLTLGAAYGGVAYQTRRALSARIEEHVRQAEGALVQARAARAEAGALRRRSFERFDAFERAEAEEIWARALSLGATLDATYGGASQQLETALMLDPSRRELRARFETWRSKAEPR